MYSKTIDIIVKTVIGLNRCRVRVMSEHSQDKKTVFHSKLKFYCTIVNIQYSRNRRVMLQISN